MKKEEIYVSVESKEQAEMFRKVLEAMGEDIRSDYFTNTYIEQPDLDYRENGWILGCSGNKKQITFGELIDLLQRKPLYKSNDGFDIFENDLVWIPQRKTQGGYDQPLQFKARNSWSKDQNMFVNKQAALEWIEAQKPKEIVLFSNDEVSANVTKHKVTFQGSTSDLKKQFDGFVVNHEQLMQIVKAMEELQNA